MSDTRAGDRAALFLLGVAIGAATALLLAPTSGARTRRRSRRQGEEVADYPIDAGKELVDKCEDLYKRSREVLEDATHELSGNIMPCASTAGNCWTRPKRSSAVQKAPPSAGNRGRAEWKIYRDWRRWQPHNQADLCCDSLPATDDLKDSELVTDAQRRRHETSSVLDSLRTK
jgi:gas vesicle protein